MATQTKKGRKPGTDKLGGPARDALLHRLRADTGKVNLKAIAAEARISRTTLMRYIAAEPGLQETLDQRREVTGSGYVKVKRAPKAVPTVVTSSASPDPLPTGSAAKLFAKLWHGLAVHHQHDQDKRGWSRKPDDELDEAAAERVREHRRHALDQAEVFEALGDGTLSENTARARLDALPNPAPLYELNLAFETEERAADEKVAAEFKAIYGYRPSARRIAELRGKPGRSFAPGEWNGGTVFREYAAAKKQAEAVLKPRKSYPPRPKDTKGHPLVRRGVMAQMLREQEAKGLTGQAAKDAALAAVRAALQDAGKQDE